MARRASRHAHGLVLAAGRATALLRQHRLARAQRDSDAKFRGLIEHATDLIAVLAADGTYLYASPSFERLRGYRPDEVQGLPGPDLIHPDDMPRLWNRFYECVLVNGSVATGEYRVKHKDGSWRFYEATYTNLLSEPSVGGVVVNARDVTDCRRAADALRESEARFRSAFEHAAIGLALADLQGRFLQVNPAFCAITGYSPAELEALDFPSITHPDDRARNLEFVGRLLEGGEPGYVLDKRYVRKNGSITWVRTSVSAVRDADGQPTALVALVEDIADRKLAEDQRLELAREQAARKQAEELARAKDQLISVVSHELASPATTLVGFADLLASGTLSSAEQQEVLTTMIEEGCRLTALIQDFLDIQRLHQGRLELHPRAIDLRGLLERAAATARSDTDHPFTLELPSSLPPLQADPARIKQAVANLLSNARKYTPPGGSIRLAARAMEDAVEVSVSDQGLGLPAEALPHVFEKFYRVNRADRALIKGTGLGLAIVKELIEAHGGQAGVESAGPGRGSRFWFRLPLAAEMPHTTPSTLAPIALSVPLRILAADDDPAIGSAMQRVLRGDGHRVTLVTSGEAAVNRLEAEPFDVVISDIGMGRGIDGWALAETVRQRWPATRVLLSTGEVHVDDARVRRLGVAGVLTKPYRPDALRALLALGAADLEQPSHAA